MITTQCFHRNTNTYMNISWLNTGAKYQQKLLNGDLPCRLVWLENRDKFSHTCDLTLHKTINCSWCTENTVTKLGFVVNLEYILKLHSCTLG